MPKSVIPTVLFEKPQILNILYNFYLSSEDRALQRWFPNMVLNMYVLNFSKNQGLRRSHGTIWALM